MAKLETTVLEMLENTARNLRVTPLNLGGLSGADGGGGGPPGGFVGQLPQREVTYDTTEAATLFTPASGMSLVDNLNHIRYRIGEIETTISGGVGGAITVMDFDGVPTVSPTTVIIFSGATITDLGGGTALVAFTGGGGGGSSFTGDADSVVLTDALGNLDTVPWLKWGTATQEFIEFGADVVGKESNAGRVGYETFGAGFFYIVGAGTSGGNRWVKIYDKLETDLVKGQIELPGLTSTVILGTNSSDTIIDATATADARYAPFGIKDSQGWIERTETWTRTGNFTFTVAGDLTLIYRKATRIRYNDGGTDYGTVISSSHSSGTTTVTLATNSDFAMAATTITDTYISYDASPWGFPDYFNFTISGLTASGSMTVSLTSTTIAKFKPNLSGACEVVVQATIATGGTTSTQIVMDAPIPVLDAGAYPITAAALDGTAQTVVALGVVNGNSVLGSAHRLQIRKTDSTNWGLGASRIIQLRGDYPF